MGLRITTDKEIAKFEAKLDVIKSEKEMYKKLYFAQNDNDREIIKMIKKFEDRNSYGETGCKDMLRRVKEALLSKTEKKLSDDIFEHYSSNNK